MQDTASRPGHTQDAELPREPMKKLRYISKSDLQCYRYQQPNIKALENKEYSVITRDNSIKSITKSLF